MDGDCDAVYPLIVNYADHILNIIERDYNLIEIINNCFQYPNKNISDVSPATFILSSISDRFRKIWANSKMNVVITSPELLLKLKSSLYLSDNNQSIYSINILNEFIFKYLNSENKTTKDVVNTKAQYLINSFNKFFSKVDNHTITLNLIHKDKKVSIITPTFIKKQNSRIKTIGKVIESGLLITYANVYLNEKTYSEMALDLFKENNLIEKRVPFCFR